MPLSAAIRMNNLAKLPENGFWMAQKRTGKRMLAGVCYFEESLLFLQKRRFRVNEETDF